MGPSKNSVDSSVDWTRTSKLHSHFVMMRAFRKALPSLFKMLTLYFKSLFSHDGYQREKLNIKNHTRSLCSVKPLHAKYGRGVVKIWLHFLIQYSSQLTQVNLGLGWISNIILKEKTEVDGWPIILCRGWWFFDLKWTKVFCEIC
jgi:hypothetical protein